MTDSFQLTRNKSHPDTPPLDVDAPTNFHTAPGPPARAHDCIDDMIVWFFTSGYCEAICMACMICVINATRGELEVKCQILLLIQRSDNSIVRGECDLACIMIII